MKILYVTTISNTVNAFLIPHIKMLIENGHQVDVAFNIVQEVKQDILKMGCKVYDIKFQRTPLSKQNISAYKELKKLIEIGNYDLVHTHTPVASVCVRLASREIKSVKVMYTAHGFHFYKGAPRSYWLLYYPVEKILSKYTDILITINNEDFKRARDSFQAKIVKYVPGVGIDIQKKLDVFLDIRAKRKELEVPDDAFLVLSVGELNKNKNHETVIKAIAKLNNPSLYYLICGQGELENDLKKLIVESGLQNQVKLLGYRNDIIELCKMSDLFVFPSFREGLSVALMEAMVAGMPVIASDIRGNSELIVNGKGGYLVNPKDIGAFATAIDKMQQSKKGCENMGEFNTNKIKMFDVNYVLKDMKRIYDLYNES